MKPLTDAQLRELYDLAASSYDYDWGALVRRKRIHGKRFTYKLRAKQRRELQRAATRMKQPLQGMAYLLGQLIEIKALENEVSDESRLADHEPFLAIPPTLLPPSRQEP